MVPYVIVTFKLSNLYIWFSCGYMNFFGFSGNVSWDVKSTSSKSNYNHNLFKILIFNLLVHNTKIKQREKNFKT